MAFSAGLSAQQSEINVTPLIDVLLVLLIIFMMIVPVTPQGLESQIPPQAPDAAVQTATPIRVQVFAERHGNVMYEVDGRMVQAAELTAVLLEKLSARAQRSVYVTAGAEMSYRDVARAVSAARAAGAAAVALGRA